MKISLALGNRDALTLQTARGCAATNLALPGFGSLLAGRRVGYPQAAITVVAFALTVFFGLKFLAWGVKNWPAINDPETDPVETLRGLWQVGRWAFLGVVLFAANWLWALATNISILRSVRRHENTGKPPKLNPA